MTPECALQVVAVGSGAVWKVAAWDVGAALLIVLAFAGIDRLARWHRANVGRRPVRQEQPGVPCPWCDDPACDRPALCDCAGPCGRRYCQYARIAGIAQAREEDEREAVADDVIERLEREMRDRG